MSDEMKHDMTEEEQQAMVDAAIAAGEAAADEDFKQDAEQLRQERDELSQRLDEAQNALNDAQEQANDAKDRMMRLQADWENYRRRTENARIQEKSLATEKLVSNLLPILDDLERALAHAEQNAQEDENLKQFCEGVSAVYDKMIDVFEKEGAEAIDPCGEAFDPQQHQAVGRVENTEVFDETVAEVYQKGYRMAGKVIRPAMVVVSYGGQKRPVEEQNTDETTQVEEVSSDDTAQEAE